MSVYDRLSGDKKSPPESRIHRRQLQFGRYDYYIEEETTTQEQQQKKRSAAEVDAIVQRLRQDIRRSDSQQQQQQQQQSKRNNRTVSEAEAREIFNRLQQCDFSRWPVESRVGRRELGQNRYDFYRGAAESGDRKGPIVTKAELEAIVGRLSAYDVAKTPPNSRALEIKQAKAAGTGSA